MSKCEAKGFVLQKYEQYILDGFTVFKGAQIVDVYKDETILESNSVECIKVR